MKYKKIPAVYKEELVDLLKSIGEQEHIENGQRNCTFCSKVITNDNIQLIIPRANNLFSYVCNDSECVSKYNSDLNQ